MFAGVIGQLIGHAENRTLVELTGRLAAHANAPLEAIRVLARHDDLEISSPILESSECLTDDDLIEIENARASGCPAITFPSIQRLFRFRRSRQIVLTHFQKPAEA